MLKTTTYPIHTKHIDINIDELSKVYTKICLFDYNKQTNVTQQIAYSQLAAIGSVQEYIVKSGKVDFIELNTFTSQSDQWKFGYLTYDVKNSIEAVDSNNDDFLNFPLLHFFVPKFVFETNDLNLIIHYDDNFTTISEVEIAYKIAFSNHQEVKANFSVTSPIKNKISKQKYIDSVNKLKKHIQQGDIYEINFCHEFYADTIKLDPYTTFSKLNTISEAPFASFCKFNHHYVLSSSPERFIKKTGTKLISQPIKGTIKRSDDILEDEKLKQELKNSKKEQTENVMIVDLVRNDLSKIATKGSVKVDELFGIYSFKQVHQLISTISCNLKENISFVDIIKALFPMGSMTGAPKIRAMQLIEETEKTKRGLYSGSIGYIKPNGDFDFNVVIRTILYNEQTNYASISVGSAITAQANPAQEYEECLLKAKAMIQILKNGPIKI